MIMSALSLESRWRDFTIPFWSLCLLFALLPAARISAYIRRRLRQRPGHCHRCGYDLRATPDRCPECGMIPSQATA